MNHEFPDAQAGFRKGRGTRDQITNICWIIGKTGEFQKKISTSVSLISLKPLTVCITTNWKIHKETEIPDCLTCLLRNLHAGQEATAGTRHRTMDWCKIRKGVLQGCILLSCLFNLRAEYIVQNARLDETWDGIKISGRNINNFRYACDTSLMQKVKRN